MTTPLKIEAGKFYRTRGGYKALVYATDATSDYCVHGKISTSDYGDSVATWIPSGMSYKSGNHHNFDLVAEWVETPVAKFWPEFKWQAMDAGGTWYAFTGKPTWNSKLHNKWYPDEYFCAVLSKDQSPTFTGKPEDSLIERKATNE